MFKDREEELKGLNKEWNKDEFSFMVVYGRRRIGKTELIKQFSRDKPHIYILVPQDTEAMQKDRILDIISSNFDERKPSLESWKEIFDYIREKLEEERIILTLDEFPYLVNSNEAITSYLQELADNIQSSSMVIVCGSSVSAMESEVLGHKSPLYGRRTGQINLQPFDFSTSSQVINYPFEEAIRSYSITGGTPMYLLKFDYEKSLKENIGQEFLAKSSFLHEEPEFLLRSELRNPKRYMSILESIAKGNQKPNRISTTTGIETGPLSKYLKTLRKLRLVKREIPVTAERKKSKRSLYKINDNFFKFWFRHVEPKQSWLEEDPQAVLEQDIMPSLDDFTASTFEEVCLEATWKLNRRGIFGKRQAKIGRWWYKEKELDIVGLNQAENKILFGECKWTKDPVSYSEIKKLRETAEKVRWNQENRNETYLLFARNGFKPKVGELGDNFKLFDLDDLEQLFKSDS